jgi:uncharacterized iron-regulated membrane protein
VKLLSILHRWSGGLIGLLLALLGLTGAILVWEGEWISVTGADDPVVERVDRIAAVSESAVADGAIRITFASEEIGLHLVVKKDGGGEYVRQNGEVAASWASEWERPELWIFDLHHHLFAGVTGEWVTGIAGIFGLLFVITGAILWRRSRRAFEWRLLPRKMQPGPIVRHHRDFGILITPLLLVSFLTGLGMLFPDDAKVVLSPFGTIAASAKPPIVEPAEQPAAIPAMLREAKARFPNAALRRLTVPARPDGAYSIRMRQPSEWTPNGRTTLYFDRAGKLVRVDDPAGAGLAASINEKFYPVHTAKVGGLAWKLAMTLSGLGLALLGSLAVWSFWIRRVIHRRSRRPHPRVSLTPPSSAAAPQS